MKKEYDIYLPLRSNEGMPFPEESFEIVKKDLLEKFGGLSIIGPVEGHWRNFDGNDVKDHCMIYRVIADANHDVKFQNIRTKLESMFDQDMILVVGKLCDLL